MSCEMDVSIESCTLDRLKGLHLSRFDDNDSFEDKGEDCEGCCENGGELDNDKDEEEEVSVVLGFVERPQHQRSLCSQQFPSKAGGVPAWLDPINLPSGKCAVCGFCGHPLQFVLQIYAPISDDEAAFHRTLFVFMCPSMECLLQDQHEQWRREQTQKCRSVKVFRCQIPHHNPFYKDDTKGDDGSDKPFGFSAELCNWCGTWKGDKLCSSCKVARYCSDKHQSLHWCSGHKSNCRNLILSQVDPNQTIRKKHWVAAMKVACRSRLWPEYEIIAEDESDFDTEASHDTSCAGSLVVSKDQAHEAVNSLWSNFEIDSERESWASFQERIAKAPDQVLRYSRNTCARPVWPMASGRPSNSDIPRCCHCGNVRRFELQILPQLLYYFDVNNDPHSLDWATIVIYTCDTSCGGNCTYKEEFAWVQLSSQSA